MRPTTPGRIQPAGTLVGLPSTTARIRKEATGNDPPRHLGPWSAFHAASCGEILGPFPVVGCTAPGGRPPPSRRRPTGYGRPGFRRQKPKRAGLIVEKPTCATRRSTQGPRTLAWPSCRSYLVCGRREGRGRRAVNIRPFGSREIQESRMTLEEAIGRAGRRSDARRTSSRRELEFRRPNEFAAGR